MENSSGQNVVISSTALVHESVEIKRGVFIWNFSHIRENCKIGSNVIIGNCVYIGPGISIGCNSKIQNGSQIYQPAVIEHGVFVGPNVVLTNDHLPRAVDLNGELKTENKWVAVGVVIRAGASIGAGSLLVAPVEVGPWAMVGAGSVVLKNVPAHAVVVGNPARQIGWVSKCGARLIEEQNNLFICPGCKVRYKLENSLLSEMN